MSDLLQVVEVLSADIPYNFSSVLLDAFLKNIVHCLCKVMHVYKQDIALKDLLKAFYKKQNRLK